MMLAAASLFFLAGAWPASAQSGITVTDTSFKLDFPNQMTFHLAASSTSQLTAASLAVHFPSTGATTRIQLKFSQDSKLDKDLAWNLKSDNSSAVGGYLVPGTAGEYSWHLVDSAGTILDTPSKPFKVVDTRRTWRELKNDRVAIYWYDGDETFGQGVFDKANQTLDSIENDIGAKVDRQIQIWMYGNHEDFISALPPGQPEWIGGQSFNDFNVVLVLASGTGLDYATRGALHEMTHQVIAEAMRGPYQQAFPHWMDEGLAVYHQFIPPHLDDFLQPPFQLAIKEDTLFHLVTLDSNFPADPNEADVAYAESYGVVEYMIHQYGADKMKQIFGLFKQGASSDEAFQQVINVDTDGLENLWRKSIGAQEKTYTKAATVTPGAVATFSLSSADTPSAATATSPAVALQVTSTPVPSSTSTPQSSSGSGGSGFCGGLFGGAGMVAFAFWRGKSKKR